MYWDVLVLILNTKEIEGVDVYVAGEINATDVLNSIPSNGGWVRLMFKHGPIVGIDLQALKATKEKQSAFVHHLALSMLLLYFLQLLTSMRCGCQMDGI